MADYWLYKDQFLLASAKVATTSLKNNPNIKTLSWRVPKDNKKPLVWIIRDPAERLLSAWCNTFPASKTDIDHRSNSVIKDWTKHEPYAKDFSYFKSFLHRYARNLAQCEDLHWASQFRYLEDINVNIDNISKIITLRQLNKMIPSMQMKNKSEWYFKISRKKAAEELTQIVETFYTDDYKLYKRILDE